MKCRQGLAGLIPRGLVELGGCSMDDLNNVRIRDRQQIRPKGCQQSCIGTFMTGTLEVFVKSLRRSNQFGALSRVTVLWIRSRTVSDRLQSPATGLIHVWGNFQHTLRVRIRHIAYVACRAVYNGRPSSISWPPNKTARYEQPLVLGILSVDGRIADK